MSDLNNPRDLNQLANLLKDSLSGEKSQILIGYSGGLDSSVLLHAAVKAFPAEKLLAVHCNHGISGNAAQWAEHCKKQAQKLGVRIVVEALNLDEKASEEIARKARYQCFADHMQTRDAPTLFLGHHADDQIETFLFRLFRGSGLKGLSAIPKSRSLSTGKLLRPLLGISKSSLQKIADQEGISWIEDESNEKDDFDRNFIRNQVLPLISSRWPGSDEKMLQTREILSEAETLLAEYAELLSTSLELRKEAFGQSLVIPKLQSLNLSQRRLVLRHLLPPVSNSDIDEIEMQFFSSRPDSHPEFIAGLVELRRFKDRLYILKQLPDIEQLEVLSPWNSCEELDINGLGKLSLLQGNKEHFEVRFRQGGERAKPVSRKHSQSLKKLMQESDIEPWLRSRMPLVFLDDELIAVADNIQCSDYQFKWVWEV